MDLTGFNSIIQQGLNPLLTFDPIQTGKVIGNDFQAELVAFSCHLKLATRKTLKQQGFDSICIHDMGIA